MKLDDLQAIFSGLNQQGSRYLVVGGLAVVAHGYGRMTVDVDLFVDLDSSNILRTFAALEALGYAPRAPVSGKQFADPELRETWIRDKGMKVLNLWSDAHRETPIDLFVEAPFDFEEGYGAAMEEFLDDGTRFRFVDLRTLMDMKRRAGREKDLEDLRHLEMLADERRLEDC